MTTYFVDMAVGADTNAGTSAGSGNAWKTVDKAMNTVAAGDKVWVKGSANYTELATIDTVGTITAPVVFEGYTTTTGDGGQATITGSSTRANCLADSTAADTRLYYVFKNFHFTAATAEGVLSDGQNLTFKNCKFSTNATIGLSCRGLVGCEKCEFSSNTTNGCTVASGDNIGGGIFVGCTFYSNGGSGLRCIAASSVVVGCVFFSNAADNMQLGANGCFFAVINCTVDGDGKDSDTGLLINGTSYQGTVVNTVLYDCTTGYDGQGTNRGEATISRNNLVNANTTAYSSGATFTGELTSAPTFVNEVAGADYHPDTGSPLKAAGFDGGVSMDIGGVQSVPGVTANAYQLKIGV